MKKLPSRFAGLVFEGEEPQVEREPCCDPNRPIGQGCYCTCAICAPTKTAGSASIETLFSPDTFTVNDLMRIGLG